MESPDIRESPQYNTRDIERERIMKTYTKEELAEIIRKHVLWIEDKDGGERANLRSATLFSATLSGANLRSANLRGANLSGADLSGANLSYASGNNREIKTLQLGKYYTVISSGKISVGCQTHTAEEWAEFKDRDIIEMDGRDGLRWWKEWKDVILKVHASR